MDAGNERIERECVDGIRNSRLGLAWLVMASLNLGRSEELGNSAMGSNPDMGDPNPANLNRTRKKRQPPAPEVNKPPTRGNSPRPRPY